MKQIIRILGIAIIGYVGFSFIRDYKSAILPEPGSLLKTGMEITYTSNGKDQPLWKVAVLDKGVSTEGYSSCSKIGITYGEARPAVVRTECLSEKYLYVDSGKGFVKSRPVGENLKLEKKDPLGKLSAIYETGSFSVVKVNDIETRVIETKVTNFSPDGNIQGRLLEKYSIGLGTAVEGTFEVPASEGSDDWVAVNKFALTRVN